MNKKFVIKENFIFQDMIEYAKKIKNSSFIIFYSNNSYGYGRYGISVGKKVGNAVTRNHLKRQVRAILRDFEKDYSFCYDCIIMVRRSCLDISYQKMKDDLLLLLRQLKEKNYGEKKKA